MKKYLFYLLAFVFVVFILPIICTTSLEGKEIVANAPNSTNMESDTDQTENNGEQIQILMKII